jgi:thiamine-monophosphate kinase
VHVALGRGAEFDAIRRMLARWGDAACGVGNDTATLDVPPGHHLVVSTDTSVEGVHFRREWLTPPEIGYRATAAALSDLAAAAASPLGVLLAISLPADWREALEGLADGVGEAARAAGAVVIGGDLTAVTGAGERAGEREGALAINVTVLGSALHPMSRTGARAGDHVYVTGVLGGPERALRAWLSGTDPAPADRARFAHPVPRIREAQWLAARGARAAIDVSDGLVGDVGQIAAASDVRISIDLGLVPRASGATPTDAGQGGEEYELAVIAPRGIDGSAFAAAFGIPLTDIGRVVKSTSAGVAAGVDTYCDGKRVDPPGGYDHLSS